ncbi:MAG: hypothetical protein SGJ21_02850 [Alphaproteobacteria bacterium]|nr:hypothetical protein [Alphaproteobacteria bacterium]
MSTSADPLASPEWEAARSDWYTQAEGDLSRLQKIVATAAPGELVREIVYAPMHDVAGLAGVLGYPLLGRIARSLAEALRRGANPLDDKTLTVCRAYLATLVALHAKDVRGEGGAGGEAILARLASIQP